MSLALLIQKSVNEYKNRTFIIDQGIYRRKEFTYTDIYERTLKLCNFLYAEGIKKGDKIIIHLPNSSDYTALLFACAISGIIAVPIDFNNRPDFVSLIYKKVRAKIVFCSIYKSPEKCKKYFYEQLNEVYERYPAKEISNKVNKEDIFEIVYTSGTTSEPKGVIIKHKNIVANLESCAKVVDFEDLKEKKLVLLSLLPLSHLFEQTVGLFLPMINGAEIVYSFSRKSSNIIDLINNEKVKLIVTVPLFLDALKTKIENSSKELGKLDKLNKALIKYYNFPLWIKKIVFRSVRRTFGPLEFFMVGGAKLDEDVEKFWRALGYETLQGYGLSEASPLVSVSSFKDSKLGSVGRIMPGVNIKIIDGEIVVKGDNVFSGYYDNDEETNRVLKDGWLHTGDLGRFDKDEFLYITGRKKNMILSASGINVYPEDIEHVLNSFDGIKDSIVLGLDNGRRIVGVILTDGKISKNELMKKVNSQLSPHQYLSEIYVWFEKDFPRTTTLKIMRRKVEEKISGYKKEDFDKGKDDFYQLIAEVCEIDYKRINEKTDLIDLGLDSIRRIELAIKIEEKYNLDFNEDDINDKTTVSDLRKLIQENKQYKIKSGISVLNSRWFAPLRFCFRGIFSNLTKPIFSIKAIGAENIPAEQAIFVANHSSMFDTLAFYRALPLKHNLKIYVAAARDYFYEKGSRYGRILGFFGSVAYNAFSFSRDKEIKQSLKDFGEIVNEGGSILIFPEGTRSTTGKLLPFKPGIGLLAWNMEIPVVPVKIKGLYDILPKGAILPKRGSAEVIFGKPVKFSRMQSFQEITDVLYKRLEKL